MSTPFSSTLGVRPDVVRIAPPVSGSSADSAWTIRVHGAEVWDAVRVQAMPSAQVGEVKRAALAVLMPDMHDPDAFVAKFAGVQVSNENSSLSDAGLRNGSTLLLMLRRRRAVR